MTQSRSNVVLIVTGAAKQLIGSCLGLGSVCRMHHRVQISGTGRVVRSVLTHQPARMAKCLADHPLSALSSWMPMWRSQTLGRGNVPWFALPRRDRSLAKGEPAARRPQIDTAFESPCQELPCCAGHSFEA